MFVNEEKVLLKDESSVYLLLSWPVNSILALPLLEHVRFGKIGDVQESQHSYGYDSCNNNLLFHRIYCIK
jgi:hypothetical protein